MKRTVRKWLSLLMAFAIVLSLMPVALAADETTDDPKPEADNWDGGIEGCAHEKYDIDDKDKPSCYKAGSITFTCTVEHDQKPDGENDPDPAARAGGEGKKVCGATQTIELKATGKHSYSKQWSYDETKHWKKCTTEGCDARSDVQDHKYDEDTGKCSTCGAKVADEIEVILSKDSYTGSGTIYITGNGIILETTLTVKKGKDTVSADDYEVSYLWSAKGLYDNDNVGNKPSESPAIRIVNGNRIVKNASVTCEVRVAYKGETYKDSVTWSGITNVGGYDGDVSVTIYGDTTYYLGDKDDKGGKSVIDQIDDYIHDEDGGYLDKIKFSRVTDSVGDLEASTSKWYYFDDAEEIAFEPEKSGTAEFDYSATSSKENDYYGTISIKVENGSSSGGDIEYSATAGQDVSFDADDFEDFWSDSRRKGSREDLDYVTFSLPSSSTGVLYDGDGSKLKSSTKCYVSAGRNETDLDDVYFEPKSSKAGTVKINFSAYGEDDTKISGTVVITYLNGNIDDITYTTNSSGKVDLKAKDFTDVFKAATGSSSSSLTITFTSLPSNGTLTYGSKDTKVTKSTTFKTSGAGNKIADVTYTASGSKSDTVTYTAASGSTKITGKILFNSVAANISLTVPYTCTSASGITFSTGDFTSRASGLTGSHSLAFGQPSGGNGGLYYTAIASQIPAGTKIPVSTLNTVTYRPSSNGATTIAFIIYDASGLVAGSGSVTITVSGVTGGTANPGNPGTTTPGGVDSFKDVNATAWYRTDLTRLVSLGIMAGRSPNKFAPEGTLNYGEALKLICKAVGVTQPEGSGAQWAANYKSYAVSQGWITSDVVLTDTITRTAIAQIGAKALGLSASSATPFPDTNDPYVAAMNTAGIILGNPDGNFNGSGNLKRSEICAIICRMLNYRDNAYNDQIPGWL